MTTFTPSQHVRVSSICGPCLQTRIIKVNRVTATVELFGKQLLRRIHSEPCSRCTDHTDTCYPFGYMD